MIDQNISNNIEVRNYVSKFLEFYNKAKGHDLETVWKLWKEHYNFAAVPPGEKGQEIAREMLEKAWDIYPKHMTEIMSWSPNVEAVDSLLNTVRDLLKCENIIEMIMIFFIGAFEGNPLVVPTSDGRTALGWPIEARLGDIQLVHELTHIVHSVTAEFEATWERSIGFIIIQEGLAMQVSKHIMPGEPDGVYTENTQGWLEECHKKSDEILQGILPFIEESSFDRVYQFTMGQGVSGIQREAYYTGWIVIERLLESGMSFDEIAHIKEADIPQTIKNMLS